MKITSTTSMVILAILVLAVLIGAGALKNNFVPSEYDDFAKGLTDAGVVLYGSYWCPKCLEQKEMFGSAVQYLNYVECSSPGSRDFDLCEGITSVPLWAGADGSGLKGKQSLEDLSGFFGVSLNDE
ncbi:MAG: hypothetical protein ABIA47_04325 [bacterium]